MCATFCMHLRFRARSIAYIPEHAIIMVFSRGMLIDCVGDDRMAKAKAQHQIKDGNMKTRVNT